MTTLYGKSVEASSRFNEELDCAVKAVSIVTNFPYEDVHAFMKKIGRRDRKKTPKHITESAIKHFNKQLVEDYRFSAKTILTLGKELPKRGIFLVFVRGHVLACRGGEIHDWSKGRRHRIRRIYKVVPA